MKNITTEEDAKAFVDGQYNEDILEYLYILDSTHFGLEECKHVRSCLKGIVARLFKLAPVGNFGQAILRNDLRDAVLLADDTNRTCLYLYIMFLANKVPAQRLWEARKELTGR